MSNPPAPGIEPPSGARRLTTLWGAALAAGVSLWLCAPAAAQVDVRDEIECLALTIYFEARGEPDEGKLAVGHVVMNRASHPLFPEDVCAVVRQGGEKLRYRCQFTWWCDGLSDRPTDWRSWERSTTLARHVYWSYSQDPTEGALWYHAEDVEPVWRGRLHPGPKIGRHIFYRLGTSKPELEALRPLGAAFRAN